MRKRSRKVPFAIEIAEPFVVYVEPDWVERKEDDKLWCMEMREESEKT